jgi:small nuclear ribonucleoprotein (snRNP)-like protein
MVNLQGKRKVSGVLRGFDIFLNLVLDDAIDETSATDKPRVGTMVGSCCSLPRAWCREYDPQVIRGNAVSNIETIGFSR